jgi:pre-mRNA-splicing factor CDC5/CEF1
MASTRHKSKKKGMDVSAFSWCFLLNLTRIWHQYNADIPFEKKPASGFYDTSEEQARVTSAPIGQSLRRLENKRKPDEEEMERKKRQRKNDSADDSHQTKFVAARDAQIL